MIDRAEFRTIAGSTLLTISNASELPLKDEEVRVIDRFGDAAFFRVVDRRWVYNAANSSSSVIVLLELLLPETPLRGS